VTGPDGNLWFTEYSASQIGRIENVGNPCDIGHYGVVNVADVQREINEALGVTAPANDLNDDGAVNVCPSRVMIVAT